MKSLLLSRCMFYCPRPIGRENFICAINLHVRLVTCLLALLMSSCADTSKRDVEEQVKVSIEALKAALNEHADSIAELKNQIASLRASATSQPQSPPTPADSTSDDHFQKAIIQFQDSLRKKMDSGLTAVVIAPVQVAQVVVKKEGKLGQSQIVQVAFSKDVQGVWKPVQSLDAVVQELNAGTAQSVVQKSGTPEPNRNRPPDGPVDGHWKEIEPGKKIWVPASAETMSQSAPASRPPGLGNGKVDGASGPAPSSTGPATSSPMFRKVVAPNTPGQVKVPNSSSGGTVSGHWKETEPGKKTWVPTPP